MNETDNEKYLNEETDVESTPEKEKKNLDFKFFKCCSASIKRFSVIMFVINIFITVIAAVVGVLLIGVYVGFDMLSLLAFPIICAVIILVVAARLLSALIYGFGEIVEKHEKE